jgi:hypothetical protein
MQAAAAPKIVCPQIEGFKFALSPDGTTCIGMTDWPSVITQTGRLDLVSVLLAMIAILLVIAALPAYRIIQARCQALAREIAEDIRKEVGEKVEALTIRELEARLPSLVQDYMDLAQNATPAAQANEIATAQEDGSVGQ